MTHARDALTDRVVTAIANAGVTVAKSRVYPSSADDLPRYNVYVSRDETDWSQAVGTAHRMLTLTVEIIVEGASATMETTLNTHCQHVEDQLNPSGSITDTLWSRVINTDIELNDAGSVALGIATLTVELAYRTLTADASSFA